MIRRVGYVNVRGLNPRTWQIALALLHSTFDLLFLAETWFVNHDRYRHHRAVIATTQPRHLHDYRPGRQKGGLYLLGTRHARSQVSGQPWITDHVICLELGRQRIAGVYFEPSMPLASIQLELAPLAAVTVLLGDLNTRFPDPRVQDGAVGPPERVAAFSTFAHASRLRWLTPTLEEPGRRRLPPQEAKLTVDHAYVARQETGARLALLSNRAMNLATDHRYTMLLVFPSMPPPSGGSVSTPPESRRYRITRLRHASVHADLVAAAHRQPWPSVPARASDRDLDDAYRSLQQQLAALFSSTVGRVEGPATPGMGRRGTTSPARPTAMRPRDDQHLAASIRLYKQAATASKENAVLVPTASARARGQSALQDVEHVLAARYAAPGAARWTPPSLASSAASTPLSEDEVRREILQQDPNKSSGADGVHTILLQALASTPALRSLTSLYNHCLTTGRTPRAWNETEIHLLVKDPSQPFDVGNARPITLISVIRKVFEKLLLARFDVDGWARLHHAQAGFRSHYSTCSHAAVVHHLLSSRMRSTAVFLDFRAAFDVLDHGMLDATLRTRGCPESIRALIQQLMFEGVSSRVFVNGEASTPFPRTQGVLQGSPLSPYLFNLFIDDLVDRLNRSSIALPICYFYADDGALVVPASTHLQGLLDEIDDWCRRHRMTLNVAKCGVLSSQPGPMLSIAGQFLPRVESYDYLGFRMTTTGIDFDATLRRRIDSAIARSRWLALFSNTWGPAHRLRVYKQYLAPMLEYGAPLVWAWASESRTNHRTFTAAIERHRELMGWIANSSADRHRVTANLCGLTSLESRFQRLRTGYQLVLQQMPPTHPLSVILARVQRLSSLHGFAAALTVDPDYAAFQSTLAGSGPTKLRLGHYLRRRYRQALQDEAGHAHLTRLIPFASRRVPGLGLADLSLSLPRLEQAMLFSYRRGVFLRGYRCVCGIAAFTRGHETCPALDHPIRLTRAERRQKEQSLQRLPPGSNLTDVDFLINTNQLQRATILLASVARQLQQAHHEVQKAQSALEPPPRGSSGDGQCTPVLGRR